ncbi:winged helix-turn-helix domain-containing protein [uncultured Photobacterium sp.]|uniref:winged helix-turn-helix domain-containing protein n=1 Tax=uncultured Photobacterium sp. TaxID=173973 RepID=UPI00261B54A7|nr:winged helix-turn-helix domain-containing protein [uncultured Photobacterium sp.]
MSDHQDATRMVKLGKAIYFDCSTKRLTSKQHTIDLNRAEREVLYALIINSPRMVSKPDLLAAGWVRKNVTKTSLFQTIRNLRIKLKEEEKGQIIELIPKLGYKIKITPYVEPQPSTEVTATGLLPNFPRKKSIKKSKLSILAVGVLLFIVFSLAGYLYLQPKDFVHKVVNKDNNNTVILLAQNEKDLEFLQNRTNQHISPSVLKDKLFFIAKTQNYYSIAFCDKNNQNTCEPNSARALTFKHMDLTSFWPLMTEESLSIGCMSVFNDDITITSSAKSYNLFLENGKVSPNLSQYFVHKKDNNYWNFTGISYRMNNEQTEFVPVSFKGGEFRLKETNVEPFIAVTTTTPEYFYWIKTKEELTEMNIQLPSQMETYFDGLYRQAIGYDSFMLYRQDGLYLWFSNAAGFYWFNKQGSETSDFPEFSTIAKCKNFLRLNPNPECN